MTGHIAQHIRFEQVGAKLYVKNSDQHLLMQSACLGFLGAAALRPQHVNCWRTSGIPRVRKRCGTLFGLDLSSVFGVSFVLELFVEWTNVRKVYNVYNVYCLHGLDCLSIDLAIYMFMYPSIIPSLCTIYLLICLSVFLTISLSVYLSICLSVYPSICLSIYL